MTGVPRKKKGTDVPMKLYRVAVVGLNHYHVTAWVESLGALRDRLEIVAVYDPDPSRKDRRPPDHTDPSLSQTFPDWLQDVPFESDLDRLVDVHKPHIALVTLPNILAPAAITKLAAAGIHILADKPGARTSSEAEGAFEAARDANVKVAIALTRRYSLGWQAAAALVASGQLGTLLATEAVLVTSSVDVRQPDNLIFRKHEMGGGVLHWLGVHEIDALLWLTGERISAVQAMAASIGESSIEVENVLSASAQYESGAVGSIHLTYAMPRRAAEGYIAIRGTKGSVKVLPDGSWTWTGPTGVLDPVIQETRTYESGPSTGYGAAGTVIIDDLLHAIHDDRDPVATGSHVLAVLRVIDAMYASVETGARVEIQGD